MEENDKQLEKPLGYKEVRFLDENIIYTVIDSQDHYNATFNYFAGKEVVPVKYKYDFDKVGLNSMGEKDGKEFKRQYDEAAKDAKEIYSDENGDFHFIGSSNDEGYNEIASDIVERMAAGEDVFGEGQVEENTNNKQMGFVLPWLLGLATGGLAVTIAIIATKILG